ncbi:MAG: VWA domain-containing protein, partial [Candidatus Acidiferrales bacterium]
ALSGYTADKIALASQMTTASLEAIARELSTIPGRKALIWVTDSADPMDYFFSDSVDPVLRGWRAAAGADLPAIPEWQNGTDVEQMIRLMNNAGIAVYTVDARGLETERLGFRSNASAAPTGSATDPVTDLLARTPQPNGDLIELAQRTGGRAFFNRNDLETGIRRALDDSQYTYSIAYAPSHNKWKGEWRKIHVKVDRPGVTILARNGYFALPAPRPMPPKNRYAFLSEIAASPVDSAQLPLFVHISTPPKAVADRILVTVDLPPQSLTTMPAPEPNGHTVGHFEIEFMQIGARNKLLDATQKQIDADLKPQEYAAMTKGGWTLTAHLPLKAGTQTLCVILHDESSDEVGSIHIPLAGPNNALALNAH